jgi:hypothetical protein
VAAARIFRRLAELLDVTVSSPADGEVLTYDSGTSKWRNEAAGGGGGLASLRAVRFPVAFDTPGIVPSSFPITSYDVETQTIVVAGEHTAAFAPGVGFVMTVDGFSNQPAGVVSSAYTTETTVTLSPGSLFPDIVYVSALVPVGATVYTPAVGDVLLGNDYAPLTAVSVSEAWNGSTPTLKVLTEEIRRAQSLSFVALDATVADDSGGASLMLSASPGFAVGANWRLWRFTTADPILVQVDDNNGADPGSSQGAAEIVLLVIPAA